MMNIENFVDFVKIIGKLKKIERTGWVTHPKIENPESVADHSFRTALLVWIISEMEGLDTEKVMKMALIHDTGESIIGDWDRFAKKKLGEDLKNKKEWEAIQQLSSLLNSDIKQEYLDLWKEYQLRETKEAKLVNQIDRLELLFQIVEYKDLANDKKGWSRMWNDVRAEIIDPDLKKIVELLEKEVTKSQSKIKSNHHRTM